MLYAFILGVGLLVGLAFLIPWLTQADPRQLARGLKIVALILLTGVFLLLLVTGRLAWAVGALAGMAPLIVGLLRRWVAGGLGRRARSAGGASEVSSQFLRMRLDHASGHMDGTVVAGTFAGRPLGSLDLSEALALRAEAAADPDSLRLLDTWLDRVHPGWAGAGGTAGQGSGGGPAAGKGAMDRAEALRVLGLEEGADAHAIRDAYRRLMAQAHPDHGGSAWMAAKLNEARDVLLDGDGSG